MELQSPTSQHLAAMMQWFPDQKALYQWGGPHFRFPFTAKSFAEDIKLHELDSCVLLDDKNQFVAFGQFYLRVGRCHLGRLVVAPSHRGQGFGRALVEQLIDKGRDKLNVSECSLFVLKDNQRAFQLYLSMNFVRTEYPEQDPVTTKDCYYMVKADEA